MCSCFLADCMVAAHDQPCSSVCSCSVIWLTPHAIFHGPTAVLCSWTVLGQGIWGCLSSLFPSRTDKTLGMQVLVLALIAELVNTGSVVLICDIDSISCFFDCSLIVCPHVFLMHPSSGTHARTHQQTHKTLSARLVTGYYSCHKPHTHTCTIWTSQPALQIFHGTIVSRHVLWHHRHYSQPPRWSPYELHAHTRTDTYIYTPTRHQTEEHRIPNTLVAG